jgi:hypothetical protein
LLSIESGELVTDDAKSRNCKSCHCSFDENQKYTMNGCLRGKRKRHWEYTHYSKLQLTREVEEMTPEKLNNTKDPAPSILRITEKL